MTHFNLSVCSGVVKDGTAVTRRTNFALFFSNRQSYSELLGKRLPCQGRHDILSRHISAPGHHPQPSEVLEPNTPLDKAATLWSSPVPWSSLLVVFKESGVGPATWVHNQETPKTNRTTPNYTRSCAASETSHQPSIRCQIKIKNKNCSRAKNCSNSISPYLHLRLPYEVPYLARDSVFLTVSYVTKFVRFLQSWSGGWRHGCGPNPPKSQSQNFNELHLQSDIIA